MLNQARHPVTGAASNVRLIRSTLHEVAFLPASFDLVICVGVLGLWCPLDEIILSRVAGMLRANGIFFFTTIQSQPTVMTLKRRAALAIRPLLFSAPRRFVEFRLREFTTTDESVRELGLKYFDEIDVTRWQSPTTRVDLHCVMARPKLAA
jgi:hypothetical protein